jgi:hypothetical protein
MEDIERLIKKIFGWFMLVIGLITWLLLFNGPDWKNMTNGEIAQILYMGIIPIIVGVSLLSGTDSKKK